MFRYCYYIIQILRCQCFKVRIVRLLLHKNEVQKLCNIGKIKSLSKQKNISIAEICSRLNLKRTYINDVERAGKDIPPERLKIIAEVLGTTVEYLTDQTDDPNAPDDPRVGFLTKKALKEFENLSDKDKETIVNLIESLSRANGGK